MYLEKLNLQGYRNIEFAELGFAGLYHYFLGKNGQGKTNLLESIGLLSALRSFRTSDLRQLINEGSQEAGLCYWLKHEKMGVVEVLLRFRKGSRELRVNGESVRRLSDFAGLFPVIVLSSLDMEMVRGAPSVRRRFLDQLISAVDPEYFEAIRNYQSALASRNALLRDQGSDKELDVFEGMMIAPAMKMFKKRRDHIMQIERYFEEAYSVFAPDYEIPRIQYFADVEISTPDSFAKLLRDSREKEKIIKATQRGPHRDDLEIRLGDFKARDYASEGQQRGLVSALRICQITYTREKTGILPLILADDVLGEFDPERRRNFWLALKEEMQVFASGTEMPSHSRRNWQTFDVSNGRFRSVSPSV
jgi:DNA replication and repair protein RecF